MKIVAAATASEYFASMNGYDYTGDPISNEMAFYVEEMVEKLGKKFEQDTPTQEDCFNYLLKIKKK